MFYDYHLHSENVQETVDVAKKLGLSGICFVINWTNKDELEAFRAKIPKADLDIFLGVELHEKPANISTIARKLRKDVDVILVHGGDLEVNRTAVETPEVDILLHPEMEREDQGLDHVMVRLAKENNVAIDFAFNDVMYTYDKTRVRVLSNLVKNAALVKKYRAPFVVTSGGYSSWDLRSPSELISFGRVLGFEIPQIKQALSDCIIKENRKRLESKWIQPGVEIKEIK